MRCFFWGTNNHPERDQRGTGVISFAIPDWGVQYRAAQAGTAAECEYAALIALLRFVETNPKAFEGKRLELSTDAAALVQHYTRRLPVGSQEAKWLAQVRAIRQRVSFDVAWVPPEQNRAIDGVLDLAPIQDRSPLDRTAWDKAASAESSQRDLPLS